MKVAHIKKREAYGFVVSLCDIEERISVVGCDTLVISGDWAQEARQLTAAIAQLEVIAPIAGITRKLKTICDEHNVAVSPKCKISNVQL